MAEYRDKPTWALLLSSDLPAGSEDKVLNMLGSVVSDFEHPLQEIIWRQMKEKGQELAGVMKVEDEDFHTIINGHNDDEVRLRLTEVIRAKVGSGGSNTQDISSKTVITRTLENHRNFFHEIQKQAEADILKMVKYNPRKTPYALMIVGVKSCIDSKISSTTELSSHVEAGITIPLDEALKSAGIVLPVNTNIDLAMLKDGFAKIFTEYSAKGERIFAIQYRRISIKATIGMRPHVRIQKKSKYDDLHTVPVNQGLFGGSDEDKLELGLGLDKALTKLGEVYVLEL